MRALLLLAVLASCDGRCNAEDAVADEVPGAMCAASNGSTLAICIKGSDVIVCNVTGSLTHTASCTHIGTLQQRVQ